MKCKNLASYYYTWPGKNEAFICEEHVGKLRMVAEAIGLPLQIRAVDPDDTVEECEQEVPDKDYTWQ